ncbi:MAG TPA: F0F1 ATP synthase subunit A [Pyrinomonadaceae bacterium]
MFFLFSDPAPAAQGAAADHAAPAAAAHHTPAIVEFINHQIGKPVHEFQLHYTKPLWDRFFSNFGTTAENVFGKYTEENAVPWYTVMFILACLISLALVWLLRGRMSQDEPGNGQQMLETGVQSIRGLLLDNVGPSGMAYLPVVATFAVLILVSNLMGLFPGLMSPTASTSVTFALGISSFVYYNYVGIKENGVGGHLKHFAGPIPWLAILMFPIELISNLVRPMSLGVRLFGNLFGDEQILGTIASLVPWWLPVPVLIMPLSVFVAFMQTFIFTLLSILYIAEVSHHEGDEHHGADDQHGHTVDEGGYATAHP